MEVGARDASVGDTRPDDPGKEAGDGRPDGLFVPIDSEVVPLPCTTDAECTNAGAAWHCGPSKRCVECIEETIPCAPGLYCTDSGRCALGCNHDADCVQGATGVDAGAAPALSGLTCSDHVCVGCAKDEDCPAGAVCDSTNRCVPGCGPGRACPTGWLCCQNQCIGLASTQRGCTACPSLCSNAHGTTTCVGDVCTPTCADSYGDCDGDPNNGCEASLDTPAHCHSCTTVCKNDHGTVACTAAGCEPTCASAYQSCDADPKNGCETNVNTSPDHCKVCGHQCVVPNAVPGCTGGGCTIDHCTGSYRNCDERLENGCEVDVSSNTAHCGGCNRPCTNEHGQTSCVNGTCVPACASGFGDCDGLPSNGCETNTDTNALHCDRCGHACPASGGEPNCVAGVCGVSTCSPGLGDCDRNGTCETTLATAANCGRCGNECSTVHGTPSCTVVGGGDAGVLMCKIECEGLWRDCNEQIAGCETPINTLTDCGACGVKCSRPHMNTTCAKGTCEPVGTGADRCESDYNDCNGRADDGCESDGKTDIDNCGGCGIKCTNSHGTTSCVDGRCVPECEGTWAVCGGDVKNGCQFDTTTPQSCGPSCTECAPEAFCMSGQCKQYVDIEPVGTVASGSASGKALTINHALSGSQLRVVVLALVMAGNSLSAADPLVKYRGVEMAKAITGWSGNSAWAGLYYIKDAALPGAGSHDVVVTTTSDVLGMAGSVMEFAGVDQANTIDNAYEKRHGNCGGDPPTDSLTIRSHGAWVIDVTGLQQGTAVFPTPRSPQESVLGAKVPNGSAGASRLGPIDLPSGATTTTVTVGSNTPLACNASAHAIVSLARGMR